MDKEIVMIRQQNWLRIINECNNRTGGTKKGWCEANGIRVRQLYYWQRNLRLLMAGQMKDAGRDDSLVPSGGGTGFADITPYLRDCSSSTAAGSPSQNPGLSVELSDCRIVLNGTWDEDSLTRIIRSIRNA